MKNTALANWLEHCLEYITLTKNPTALALFEGVLHAAGTGQTEMLGSIVGGAARNAVAMGTNLEPLLNSIQITKLVVWGRLELEVDPDEAWDMMVYLELIFQTATAYATKNYAAALVESHRRQSAEAARLSREAEKKVMTYATELARANRELARLEKAKTDFISIAAHELKTPLTVVQGYIDMLLEPSKPEQDNSNEFVLQGIAAGTDRLALIIDDLLDVSAIETGSLVLHPESVAIDSLVKLLVKRTEATAEIRKQTFQVDVEEALPTTVTDPKRVYQVLNQILNNAVKYTPDGGLITVKTYLEIIAGNNSNYIKIEIADTGIGISPEDREHVFDKFYRVGETQLHSTGKVKFKGAGPGLGLSIAKGIIDALQGEIWVESHGYDEINCPGSTFYIRLPVKE